MKLVGIAVALVLAAAACAPGESRLVVAAGTTIVDSGFIDHVVASFEQTHPDIEVSVVGQPTRLALELGRDGAVDVTITHAPVQEARLVAAGHVLESSAVFVSEFVLVGPPTFSEQFAMWEFPEVLRAVFVDEIVFVSRSDGSGTHDKEMENWLEAGFQPSGADWYIETGQGMGPTLLVADQREALTLSESGAFIAAAGAVDLVDLGVNTAALDNPYTAMVMESSDQKAAARMFVDWLLSPEGRTAIETANRELFGKVVYAPAGDS